jgi:hypothetical protein
VPIRVALNSGPLFSLFDYLPSDDKAGIIDGSKRCRLSQQFTRIWNELSTGILVKRFPFFNKCCFDPEQFMKFIIINTIKI